MASLSKSMFLSVDSTDLVSHWGGESEKYLKAIFKMARYNKPSIVFVDEIDSVFGNRYDESERSQRLITEFLIQI